MNERQAQRMVAQMFERPDDNAAKSERRIRRGMAVALVILTLCVIGMTTQALWDLWRAWQTGYERYWKDFWDEARGASGFILAWLPLIAAGRQMRRIYAGMQLLRQAALRGDDQTIPPAAEQPLPLASVELPIGPVMFGPFVNRGDGRTLALGFIAAFLGLTGGVLAALAVSLALSLLGGPASENLLLALILGSLAAIMLGMTVWALLALRRIRRGVRLIADDWGLGDARRSRRGKQGGIAWHEVRAFYMLSNTAAEPIERKKGKRQAITYTLDSGGRLITWTLSQRSKPAERADHERLCRLIVTRTKQPLRDFSAQIRELVKSTSTSAGQEEDLSSNEHPELADSGSSGAPLPARSRGKRWALAWIPFALVAMLYGGGWGAQHVQTQQYVDLVARIHAQTPIFHDSLHFDDGQWPVQAGSTTQGSYTFVGGAYQMTGGPSDWTLGATTDAIYGDVAVEVTAQQQGPNPQDGVGVIIRQINDGRREIVYSVTTAGTWSLSYYQATSQDNGSWTNLVDNESSSAIHTGSGATNRLLLLVRGSRYTCFVNNLFVGTYEDKQKDLPTVGHFGMYLGDSTTIGTFNDFTVYPAPES